MSSELDFKQIPNGIEVKAKIYRMGEKVWIVFSLPQEQVQQPNSNTDQAQNQQNQIQQTSSSQQKTTRKSQTGQKETTRRRYKKFEKNKNGRRR